MTLNPARLPPNSSIERIPAPRRYRLGRQAHITHCAALANTTAAICCTTSAQ
jgi:hypothetical protein